MTGAVRLFDPETSYQAAQCIGKGVESEILRVFHDHRYGGEFTDDELCGGWFSARHAPTIKSARSRLTRRGLLEDSGQRRPSNRGRDQIVWKLR